MGQLSGLAERGTTIVCSTHDRELIAATDDATTLTNGRLVPDPEPT